MSLVNNIKGFLTNADLYSQQIDFTYRENKSFSSTCGGCVSLVLGGILFLYTLFLIYKTFSRDDPIIVKNDFNLETPYLINVIKDISFSARNEKKIPIQSYLKNTTFYLYLAFGIQDNLNNLALQKIDPTYFTLSINEISNKSNLIKTRPLNFYLCTKFGEFETQFQKLNLSYTYCVFDSYAIFGKKNQDFSKVSISVSKCVNNTSIICRSIQEINKKVENFKMTLYYSADMVNLTNTNNPVASFFKNQYWDIVSTWKKNSELTLVIEKVDSYDSIFPVFFHPFPNYYYALKPVGFVDTVMKLGNDSVFFNLDIKSGDFSTVYQRSYLDIFSQLSNVGGITNIIMPLGFIFVFYFAYFKTDESLANDFYNIISPDNNKNINIPFEDFIKNHYNYLINKTLKGLKEESKIELQIEEKNRQKEEEEDLDVSSFLGENKSSNQTFKEPSNRKQKTIKAKKGFISKILKKIKSEESKKREEDVINNKENMNEENSKRKDNTDLVQNKSEREEKIKDEKQSNDQIVEINSNNLKEESKKNGISLVESNLNVKDLSNRVNEDQTIKKIEEENYIDNDNNNEKGNRQTMVEENKNNIEPRELTTIPITERERVDVLRKGKLYETEDSNNLSKLKKNASITINKSSDSKIIDEKQSLSDSDYEEDEEDKQELNGMEKYITKEIIEKIYGFQSEIVKEEIKKLIKKKIFDKKNKQNIENNPLFMTRRKSKQIALERYEKFKKILKKSLENNADIETELEEMKREELDTIKFDQGLFEKILMKNPRNELEFQKYKILYDLTKYETNDKMLFSNYEIFQNICCYLCLNKKYLQFKNLKKIKNEHMYGKSIKDEFTNDFGKSIHVLKKHKIFEITRKKLSIDLDIINVLKTARDFDKFKNIYFDKTQKNLFESETKPIITEDDDNLSQLYNVPQKLTRLNTNILDKKKTIMNGNNSNKTKTMNLLGTNSLINVEMINFDDDTDEGESDFKKIRFYDKLLSFIMDKNEINLMEQKMLLNMGIQIDEIVLFNHLLNTYGKKNNDEVEDKEKKKLEEEQKMKDAYPNILHAFFKTENTHHNYD